MNLKELAIWLESALVRCDVKIPSFVALRIASELPGVVVDDDYLRDMAEMLHMHAVATEAELEIAKAKEKSDRRKDGSAKVEHIANTSQLDEKRTQIADLAVTVAARIDVCCKECGSAPPSCCKMSCDTRRYL